MKKTLVSVIAVAAMVLGLAGCNMGLKAEAGSWKAQKYLGKDADHRGEVQLTIDGDITPTWSVWTSTSGEVLDPQPTGPAIKDGKWTWTFDLTKYPNLYGGDDTENMILYIDSNEKDEDGNDLDYRGRICVYRDGPVAANYTKPFEKIPAVGAITIKNNEPTSNSTFKNGDYTITKIRPLTPKTADDNKIGGIYEGKDSIQFKNCSIGYNDSFTFLCKAGETVVGLYQPNRNKKVADGPDVEYNGPNATAIKTDLYADGKTRAEIFELKLKDDASDEDVVNAFKKANVKMMFAKKFTVVKHSTTATEYNSSTFNDHMFFEGAFGKITRYKAAENDYVSEAVALPAVEK